MIRYRFKFKFLPLLLIGLVACQKEEYTQPVTVNVEVEIAEGSLSHLTFDIGVVMFSQISFDGQREQGGDVYFSTEEGDDIGMINFSYQSAGYIKKFDIPQGIYSYMQWRFEMEDIEEEGDEELMDVEGGLLISGKYQKQDGTQLPLYIVVDDEEQFAVVS